jgi:hypothetical protein
MSNGDQWRKSSKSSGNNSDCVEVKLVEQAERIA